MTFYDRYTGEIIQQNDLPSQIDLGRFFSVDDGKDLIINKYNEILEDQILQKLFKKFLEDVQNSHNNSFTVWPIIQNIHDKIDLNEFEKQLLNDRSHIEDIFRNPHCLLNKTIEKVHVSRAKRIPAKSYQHLASHTEDWLQKSVVGFSPLRILHETLDLFFDLYENQATVAFVELSLKHLKERIRETGKLAKLTDKIDLLKLNYDNGWYAKNIRILELAKNVYFDINYRPNSSESISSETVKHTDNKLKEIQKRLNSLRNTSLYKDVNKKTVRSLMGEKDIRATNVIVNHKHYKCIRKLWRSLRHNWAVISNEEIKKAKLDLIAGIRCYSQSVITYIVKELFNYNLSGNYSNWEATSDKYCNIFFREEKGVFFLNIGNSKIKFIVLGNKPSISEECIEEGNYILYYDESSSEENDVNSATSRSSKIISISPYDPESVERVGRIIYGFILNNYLKKVEQKNHYTYPKLLKSYIKCINSSEVVFEPDFYFFKRIPLKPYLPEKAVRNLESDEPFKQCKPREQAELRESMRKLVSEINENAKNLLSMISCQNFMCNSPASPHDIQQLNYYVECPKCGAVLDKKNNHIILKNKKQKYSHLSDEDWGMDYVDVNIS